MTWEARLLALFDDLEAQAEGLALASRDAEVAELARAEYAAVDLESRLHASTGRPVTATVAGAGALRGRLVRAGAGWCLLATGTAEWVVLTAALTGVRGLAAGARPMDARSLPARLGIGSVLRSVAEERAPVLLVDRDGARRTGRVGRVGADFLELGGPAGSSGSPGGSHGPDGPEVVPVAALAALRRG